MTSLSIRRPATIGVLDWFTYSDNTIDGQSRKKAYTLFESDLLNSLAPGSMKCLQQIHAYLFGGLYDFAGQIRDKNISKGGFTFANCMHFPTVIPTIERIPETTLDEIADKYVEMNVVHPFMEGNGRSMRIWLDLMLRHSLKRCVDWSRIDKNEYLTAMRESVVDSSHIKALLKVALTDKINDREMFMKGIDYSYYYEEEDIAIISVGHMFEQAVQVRKRLKEIGYNCTLINARFVKPVDEEMLRKLTVEHRLIVTLEENIRRGGFGEFVIAYLAGLETDAEVLNLALPDDYIEHGSVDLLRSEVMLDIESCVARIITAYIAEESRRD